jgi:hypothetical protein
MEEDAFASMHMDIDADMQNFMVTMLRQMARQRAVDIMESLEARLDVLDKERAFLKGDTLEDIKAMAMVAVEYLEIANMFNLISKHRGMEKTEEDTHKFTVRFKEIMILAVSYGYMLGRDAHEVQ